MIKKAMVFAAGFGKRMLPITKHTPKPLVKVAEKSMLDYNLELLEQYGVEEIIVNSHHLSEKIHEHINKRKKTNSKITISHEEEILETGGGLKKALALLGNDAIFTMNSDVIILNGEKPLLNNMVDFWDESKMDALMLLLPTENAVGYEGNGDFNLNEKNQILRNEDKQKSYVFTGVMIIKTSILKDAPDGSFSIYRDFLKTKYMQNDGTHSKIYGLVHDGKWLHVGTPDSIALAENQLLI